MAANFDGPLSNPSLPTGILQSSGVSITTAGRTSPLLAAVTANGDVRSTGMTVTSQNAQVATTRHRSALFAGERQRGQSQAYTLSCWEARWQARSRCVISRAQRRSHLSASFSGVSLAELQSESCRANEGSSSSVTNQIAVRGSINATADATWGKTMQDLLARADATLQAGRPAGTRRNINSDQWRHSHPIHGEERATVLRPELHPNPQELRSRSTAPSATMRRCRFV